MRPGTIVTHSACGLPVFFVEGGLRDGDVVPPASAWIPLRPDWPQPGPHDEYRCPNCGKSFAASDRDLGRRHVDDIEPWGYGV